MHSRKGEEQSVREFQQEGNGIYRNNNFILEMKGSKTSFARISQAFSDESYSFPNRQYNRLVLSCEDGGNQKQVFNRIIKREVSPTPWDHNYCRISSKLHESGARFAVKKLKRSFRVELLPQVFQRICQIKGKLEMDLFASRLSEQLPRYIAWKPDPYSQGTDAMQQIWPNQYRYAFPPFSMINKVLRKIAQDQVKRMLTVAPTWQSQVWYPTPTRISIEKPLFFATPPASSIKPPGSDTSINNKQNIKISGLVGFRQRLLATEISGRASKLISSTRRQGSLSNYNSSWSKWASWRGKRKLIHFNVL